MPCKIYNFLRNLPVFFLFEFITQKKYYFNSLFIFLGQILFGVTSCILKILFVKTKTQCNKKASKIIVSKQTLST